MAANEHPSPVPIPARLKSIEIVGEINPAKKKKSNYRSHYFVTLLVDETEITHSEKKPRIPSPRWEWSEGPESTFLFHPSATIKIEVRHKVYTNELIGEYTGKVVDILNNNGALIDLEDETGAAIAAKLIVDVSLDSDPEKDDHFKNLMENITANVSRLESAQSPTILSALGVAFKFTKKIMDIVKEADPDPILKTSWAVISVVYAAVERVQLLDDAVRELAEKLREVLGLAKERPDLLVIKDTTNVIKEIGRISLKVASLIHEYTRPNFGQRIVISQFSDKLESSAEECKKALNELEKKFNTRMVMGISEEVKETKQNTAMIRRTLQTNQDRELADKIWGWLGAPDSSKNYNDALEKRQKDTLSWFLDGEFFDRFKDEPDFLWIKGTTGCGKTVLCSSIIAKIIGLFMKEKSVAYGYFFFDSRDSQKDLQLHDKLIRSLIRQLSAQCDGVPDILVDLYNNCLKGHQQPSTRSLQDTLHHLIGGFSSTYIIIDSLDECIEREKTLPWIKEIINLGIGNLHMVAASRPEPDITKTFQSSQRYVDLGDRADNDISTYLEQELQLIEKWDKSTRNEVMTTLSTRANGMFRWAALQLLELKGCPNQQSLMSQLNNLPKGLYETYDRILSRITQETDCDHVATFLRWLCFSASPMTLEQIAETIVVEFSSENDPKFVESRRYYNKNEVLEKCSALVTTSEGAIKLSHFSVKEYLCSCYLSTVKNISNFHLDSRLAHSIIAQTCLAYLLHFDSPNSLKKNFAQSFPLAQYAARHWIDHTHSANIDKSEMSAMWDLARKLFDPDGTTLTNWVRIWNIDVTWADPNPERSLAATPLYYASLAGVTPVARHLLECGAKVNLAGGTYGSALQAASRGKHTEIVELLLKHDADVNLAGGLYGSALQAASAEGHTAIVELLLEHGADVNLARGLYGSALQAASAEGHTAIVELLLEHGADVNRAGGDYGSALQAASMKGHTAIVELLLEHGVDVNLAGGAYGSTLNVASMKGHTAIVELLLEHGADVNRAGGDYGGALQVASQFGYTKIVELLLEHGADVNRAGGDYGSALQAASRKGHTAIVELLLEHGADVNRAGGDYGSALQAASQFGYTKIVELLLEHGADVNLAGGAYGSALKVASMKGHTAIVELLLEHGVDVNRAGGNYGSALQAASAEGHTAIVELLLEHGADVNRAGGDSGSALQTASMKGHTATVKLLLKHEADVNLAGGAYGSALQAASLKGHTEIVELLLEHGADVNRAGGENVSSLQAASLWGHTTIVELLLKRGADVNLAEGEYGSALRAASAEGHTVTVKLLLEHEADVNLAGGDYNFGSALQAASGRGRTAIVELLLEHGADVNLEGGHFGNALQAASYRGHTAIIELLLEHGVDVNLVGGIYGNALQAASVKGHTEIVELLLEHGADVNPVGVNDNPLQAASAGGHTAVVELLLKYGADINLEGRLDSALQAASAEGYDDIVQLLQDAEKRSPYGRVGKLNHTLQRYHNLMNTLHIFL